MATHSSVLAWRIPGTEEPARLLSMGSHRVGHDWSDLAAAAAAAARQCWVWKMFEWFLWMETQGTSSTVPQTKISRDEANSDYSHLIWGYYF